MLHLCNKVEKSILDNIAKAAEQIGCESYVIGGFVRDKILERPSKDIDVVCVGDGPNLAEAFAKLYSNEPTVNIFKTYGTAQVKINVAEDKAYEIEFVGARKESYRAESRNPIVEPGTLQDDQERRDFTINAMAISLNKNNYGQLIDPFNGLKHIEQKLLITPLEPETTFSDDPLRMMRAIRFASQLQFTIEPYTLASIGEQAERIKIITQERITDELNKIVLSKKPSIGFNLLDTAGLLKIIFPQFCDLKGVEFVGKKGHKDNFIHTLQVLDNICVRTKDLWLRWAAILHDIAKPATKRFEPAHGWTFHGHEHVGAKMVPRIFKNLKLPLGAEMLFVQKMVLLHLRPIGLTKENITDSAVRRLLFDAGEDIDSLMQLCHADITSKDANKVARYKENFTMVQERMTALEQSDSLRNWQPPISGELIMETFNLKPCKLVGDLKNEIREAILDGHITNNYEEALQLLLQKGKEAGLEVMVKP
jgi:poly(A) polymerase